MELKVSSTSPVNKLATAIAEEIRANGRTVLLAIGAGAVNQAIKGLASARGFLAPQGINIAMTPAFIERTAEAGTRTIIKMEVWRL